MNKTFAIMPAEVWRAAHYAWAIAIMAELTAAGNDPEKVTTALHKILDFNAAAAQVVYEDRPVNP